MYELNNFKIFMGGISLNKSELVSAVAEKAEMTKKDAKRRCLQFWHSIEEALVSGDKVQLVGFGTLK